MGKHRTGLPVPHSRSAGTLSSSRSSNQSPSNLGYSAAMGWMMEPRGRRSFGMTSSRAGTPAVPQGRRPEADRSGRARLLRNAGLVADGAGRTNQLRQRHRRDHPPERLACRRGAGRSAARLLGPSPVGGVRHRGRDGLCAPRRLQIVAGDRDPLAPVSGFKVIRETLERVYGLYNQGHEFIPKLYAGSGGELLEGSGIRSSRRSTRSSSHKSPRRGRIRHCKNEEFGCGGIRGHSGL